jgi:hypothetical protein
MGAAAMTTPPRLHLSGPCQWGAHDQCDGWAIDGATVGQCECVRHAAPLARCAGDQAATTALAEGACISPVFLGVGDPSALTPVGWITEPGQLPTLLRELAAEIERVQTEGTAGDRLAAMPPDPGPSGSSWRQWCAEHNYRCPSCGVLFADLPAGHRLGTDPSGRVARCTIGDQFTGRAVEVAGPYMSQIAALLCKQTWEDTWRT